MTTVDITSDSVRDDLALRLQYIALSSKLGRDLTSQVIKADPFYFKYGGMAEIWRGQLTEKDSGSVKEVAVKVLKGADEIGKQIKLLREVLVWSTVSNPNITPFLGVTSDFHPGTLGLVSPLYPHGTITDYVKKHPGVDKVSLITQVALGLLYLHDKGIIHGDMKGSNILINNDCEASIADFGLSRILQTSGFTTDTASGSMRYMGPELFSVYDEDNDSPSPGVTKATDVYAFAVTVIEIFTESVPYSHIKNDATVIIYVKEGGRPKRESCRSINNEIWTVLERSWDVEPNRRLSMDVLVRFFTSLG